MPSRLLCTVMGALDPTGEVVASDSSREQVLWQPWVPPAPCFTFEERADLPHRGCPFPVELAQRQLHVEEGHPSDDEKQRVRDQEGTCRTQRRSVTPQAPARPGLPRRGLGPRAARVLIPPLASPLPEGDCVAGT